MKGAKLKKTIEGEGKSGGGENKNCTSTRKQKIKKKNKKTPLNRLFRNLWIHVD